MGVLAKKKKGKQASSKKTVTNKKSRTFKKTFEQEFQTMFKHVKNLKQEEIKEALLINAFKLNLVRAQIDALITLLKDKEILTYEEFWNKTKQFLEESIIE